MPENLINLKLTGASYGKRTYGVGCPGGPAEFFMTTKGRDYDKDDLVVFHRMIQLWNACRGVPVEKVAEMVVKLESKQEAKSC